MRYRNILRDRREGDALCIDGGPYRRYSLFTVITSPSVGFSGKISPSAFLGRKRSSALTLTVVDLSIRLALPLDAVPEM